MARLNGGYRGQLWRLLGVGKRPGTAPYQTQPVPAGSNTPITGHSWASQPRWWHLRESIFKKVKWHIEEGKARVNQGQRSKRGMRWSRYQSTKSPAAHEEKPEWSWYFPAVCGKDHGRGHTSLYSVKKTMVEQVLHWKSSQWRWQSLQPVEHSTQDQLVVSKKKCEPWRVHTGGG